jgi:hypothetical protein
MRGERVAMSVEFGGCSDWGCERNVLELGAIGGNGGGWERVGWRVSDAKKVGNFYAQPKTRASRFKSNSLEAGTEFPNSSPRYSGNWKILKSVQELRRGCDFVGIVYLLVGAGIPMLAGEAGHLWRCQLDPKCR